MNPHTSPTEISAFLERTPLRVQKPARYTAMARQPIIAPPGP